MLFCPRFLTSPAKGVLWVLGHYPFVEGLNVVCDHGSGRGFCSVRQLFLLMSFLASSMFGTIPSLTIRLQAGDDSLYMPPDSERLLTYLRMIAS